jgi:hypothetical protein
VAAESLRNSYMQILKLLPRLVAEIQVLPIDMCMSEEQLRDIWLLLGVADDVCAELVSLRLICIDGKLQATMDLVSEGEFATRCYSCLAALWRFPSFSAGRWLSVAAACKGLARAIMSGIDRLVRLIQADEVESSFFINGWSGLGGGGREFVFVAPLAGRPCDTILLELMQDSRVAANADRLEAQALAAMDEATGLSEHVWGVFAAAADTSALLLKTSAAHAAHVSLSFASMRIFEEVRQLPWSLARGDVEKYFVAAEGG